MNLVLSEEARLLKRAVGDFVRDRSSLKRVRAGAASGWSRELWQEMAKLGWLGLLSSDDSDADAARIRHQLLMVVCEELGRGLMLEPFLSTAVFGTQLILLGGSPTQRRHHLPALARGEYTIAVAYQEAHSRWSLSAIETVAAASKGGAFALSGEKTFVLGGGSAEWIIVSAQHASFGQNAIALFLVPVNSKGVTVERQVWIDGRDAATIRLTDVHVDADALLGSPTGGLRILERAIDVASIALSSEILGTMSAAFEMTLDYLKTREQFGVKIGSFQALQHRAARLYVETELARSAVMFAHALLDEGGTVRDVGRAASVAKAKCAEASMLVTHEAIQMHGGIGMTDEHDIGLFLKRARVAEMTFGNAIYHRDRVARLGGY